METIIDNGPYIEADICTPDYELIQPVSVFRERGGQCDGYLIRMYGRLYFAEQPSFFGPLPKLPVLWSAIERSWPIEELYEDDGYSFYDYITSAPIDPFKEG